MIFLNKKQMLPLLIALSILLLPVILLLLTCFLLHKEMRFFFVLVLFSLLYVVGFVVILKISLSKKEYLIIENDRLDLYCNNKYSKKNAGVWKLYYNKIIRIDYYRITSIKGWFCVFGGVAPKCVFITIENQYGFEEAVFIGYLDLKEVKQIASIANTELVFH